MNYYNEIDPAAAQWLRNLIAKGLIPPGFVDERSIAEVQPYDLDGYTQCHFFAGIGGWSLALQLAGWPANEPVWTGSCPCQPFSVAGERKGFDDERHLWPEWFRLIRERKPGVVFGEQVAGAVNSGWLDLVSSDLEGQGYAFGAAVLGAHSVGAPHIRQRLYFGADSIGARSKAGVSASARWRERLAEISVDGGRGVLRAWEGAGLQRGVDGPSRWIEPGIAPLADGVPARVVRLRAYGNAIVPQVAAAFVRAAA
jgi:DNA (cytosine-5)-methyltransferase 1